MNEAEQRHVDELTRTVERLQRTLNTSRALSDARGAELAKLIAARDQNAHDLGMALRQLELSRAVADRRAIELAELKQRLPPAERRVASKRAAS